MNKKYPLFLQLLFSVILFVTCSVDNVFYSDSASDEYRTISLSSNSDIKVAEVEIVFESGDTTSFFQEIIGNQIKFFVGNKVVKIVKVVGYDLNDNSFQGDLVINSENKSTEFTVVLSEKLPDPPSAPILFGETIDTTLLSLTWKKVFGITGYKLERSEDGAEFSLISTQIDTFRIDTLEPGTKMWYRVAAYNKGGSSAYSNVVSLITASVPAPETPTGFDTVAVSVSGVKLKWEESTVANMYYIYRGIDGGATGDTPYDSTVSLSYEDSNIIPEKLYSYVLTAANSSGESAKTSVLNVTIPEIPLDIPEAPTGVTADGVSESVILIKWIEVALAEGYVIYSSNTESETYLILDTVEVGYGANDEYSHGGLSPETTKYYKVSSYNSVGESSMSNFVTATTDVAALQAPNAPLGVNAESLSSSSITVTWASVTGASGYVIFRNSSRIDTVTGTSFVDNGLTSNTSYSYEVSAYNSVGESDLSSAVSATTLIELSVPTGLTATAISSSSIDVSWEAVSGAEGYELFRSLSETGSYVKIATQSATTYSNGGLSESTTYYYKVLAYLSTAKSDTSTTVSATTDAGATAPDAPTGLTATSSSTSSIAVNWNSVADADSYKLYSSTTEDGFYSEVYAGTALSTTNTGLASGSTYYYKVTAINSDGESVKSTSVNATTETATVVKMKILFDKCKPCGTCKAAAACPNGAIFPYNGKNAIDPDKCDGCGGAPQCVAPCPVAGCIVEDN